MRQLSEKILKLLLAFSHLHIPKQMTEKII